MNTKLEIRKVNVKDINPAAYNPRVMSPAQLEKLRSSLEKFGYVDTLVWNQQTGHLVGGHQRLKILMEKEIQEIEVSVVDLALAEEKILNLALNNGGDWEYEMLASLLEELSKLPDVDISLTGFELPEISEIIDRHSKTKDEDQSNPGEPGDSNAEPITQKGEIIELGRHRILCGDTSSLDDIQRLMGSENANLILLDPPYNCQYYGGDRPHANARPKQCKHWQRIYADDMPQAEYEQWMKKIFTNISSILAPGCALYCWNGHKQFGPMHRILNELGFHVSCVITWAKPNFAISYGDYNQQTEFCLYSWKEGNGAHLWYGPTNESTLWEVKRDPSKDLIHPTQKSIKLGQRAIRNSSQRDDLVFEGFLGSGSSLIAAESLERRCFGVEIDPKYVDAIIRRYIAFVGPDKAPQELKEKYLIGGQNG